MAIIQAKAPNPQTLRKITLEGHRFSPAEALSLGLVDGIITDDSDVFLFGGARVLKNMLSQSKRAAQVQGVDEGSEVGRIGQRRARLASASDM